MQNRFMVRQFGTSDIEAVRGVDLRAFPPDEQYDVDFYERIAESKQFDAIVVMHGDNEVVGWALIDTSRRPIRIRSVSVLPEYRGRGTGTELINTLLNRHSEETDLLVDPNNRAAVALYQRLHFEIADPDPEMPQRLRMLWRPR